MLEDARLDYPATQRNKEPLLTVIARFAPAEGTVLEVASGSGQHMCHFARALPHLTWLPSDPDPRARASIAAWTTHEGLENVRAPLALDATEPWPVGAVDMVININMIHIAPWSACKGLMRGAGRVLPAGGHLLMYGPYLEEGVRTAPSNLAFDESLRRRDPAWGVRNLGDVEAAAAEEDLTRVERVEMPANNVTVVFRKT